jgi:hypothetical protein
MIGMKLYNRSLTVAVLLTITAAAQAKRARDLGVSLEGTPGPLVNALVAVEDMTGIDGHRVTAIPHDALRQSLKKYNR